MDQIDDCRMQSDMIRQSSDDYIVGKFLEINEKLKQPIAQEEAYWKQCAKIFWLKDGDISTKFFHNVANATKKKIKWADVSVDSLGDNRNHIRLIRYKKAMVPNIPSHHI